MKIKYVHVSFPGVEKIHDTEKSMKGCAGFVHMMGGKLTQEEWDRHEVRCFERDKANGIILSYNIIEEE